MRGRGESSSVGTRAPNALIGPLLEGAWRVRPSSCRLTPAELASVLPLIVGSGAAALAWARIRDSDLARTPEGSRLQRVARKSVVANAIREALLAEIVGRLNAAGVRPLIIKGWSVSRRYANPLFRPFGDFDLLSTPGERAAALGALREHCLVAASKPREGLFRFRGPAGGPDVEVDFHDGLPSHYATALEGLLSRAREIALPGGEILLEPCPEDHLRIVVLHFWKHGGWRPLWLCDIAAMAEAAGAEFDWDLCFGQDPISRGWVETGISVARHILGCEGGPPMDLRPPPKWLIATILREWRAPYPIRFRAPDLQPTPRFVLDKLASYWLNPIGSSMLLGRALSPIRPIQNQIAYWVMGVSRAAFKFAG